MSNGAQSTLDRYGHDLVRSSARIFIAENRLRAERGISTGVMRVTGDIVAVAAQETALESGVVPVAGRSPPPPASGSLPPPGGVHPALTGADSDSDGEDDLVQAGSATPGGVRAALLAAPDDAGGGSTAGALPTGRTPPPAPLGSLHDAFLEDVATT